MQYSTSSSKPAVGEPNLDYYLHEAQALRYQALSDALIDGVSYLIEKIAEMPKPSLSFARQTRFGTLLGH